MRNMILSRQWSSCLMCIFLCSMCLLSGGWFILLKPSDGDALCNLHSICFSPAKLIV